jgi:hypothetical protein
MLLYFKEREKWGADLGQQIIDYYRLLVLSGILERDVRKLGDYRSVSFSLAHNIMLPL